MLGKKIIQMKRRVPYEYTIVSWEALKDDAEQF